MQARTLTQTAQIVPFQTNNTRQLWQNFFSPENALLSVIDYVETKGSSQHERHTMLAYLSSLADYCRFLGASVTHHEREDYTWDFSTMAMPTKANTQEYIANCKRKGLSSKTIVRYMASIRHFLRALYEQDPTTPQSGQDFLYVLQAQKQFQIAASVKNPSPDKKTSRPALETHGSRLELDEIDLLFSSWRPSFNSLPNITTLAGKRDIALVYLGLISGLRASELGRLKLENIQKVDDTNYAITVRGKGNKFDPVGIDAEAYALVQQFVEFWNGFLPEDDSRRITATTPIFQPVLRGDNISENLNVSKGINPRNLSEIVTKRIAAALPKYSVKKFTAHDMRRTCAYIMRELGYEWDMIRQKLRHESIATTERYVGKKLNLEGSNWTKKRRFNLPQDVSIQPANSTQ